MNAINFKTRQIDESDCGVACLSSIIIHYGGFVGIEELRELSGTTKFGTTMLGLYQAAEKSGLTAVGGQAGVDYLKELTHPVILHVVIDGYLNHYLVFYYCKNGVFYLGDPAIGVVKYTEQELDKIWLTKTLLELTPNDHFSKVPGVEKEKRKWFLKLVKEDYTILTSVFVLGVFTTLFSMSLLIFIQQLLDTILPSKSESKLVSALAAIGLLIFLRSWLNNIRGNLLNLQGQKFNNRIIDVFFHNLLHLPKTFFVNRKIGELVARMEDTARIQSVIAYLVGDFTKEILSILISFLILFYYSATIGFAVLLSLPIFIFLSALNHKKIVKGHKEVMIANAQKTSNYINTMQSIDTIKVNNKHNYFSNANKRLYGAFQEKIFTYMKN
ncbi:MAG: cysteine peptidase family C39 domain-containing protein [Sediminibacterium sp.]